MEVEELCIVLVEVGAMVLGAIVAAEIAGGGGVTGAAYGSADAVAIDEGVGVDVGVEALNSSLSPPLSTSREEATRRRQRACSRLTSCSHSKVCYLDFELLRGLYLSHERMINPFLRHQPLDRILHYTQSNPTCLPSTCTTPKPGIVRSDV